MRRATVDLPQPDSPTRESVSPRLMEKETPSTAFSSWRGAPSMTRFSHGRDTSKSLVRLVTSRSGRSSLLDGTDPGPRALGSVPGVLVLGMHRALAPVALRARRRGLGRVQPARRERPVGRHEIRALDLAAIEYARAARIEGAARGDRVQPRHGALDLREAVRLQSALPARIRSLQGRAPGSHAGRQ